MSANEIPIWFWRGVGLVTFWFLGQLLVEWIKTKMRNGSSKEWSGEERRASHSVIVDEHFLNRFMETYEKNVELFKQFHIKFDEHDEKEQKSHRYIKEIHSRIVTEKG